MSEDYEREGLGAPFKGITTNGEVMPGLFEIKPTGVSTERTSDQQVLHFWPARPEMGLWDEFGDALLAPRNPVGQPP